jgi:CubicO group peptidase (beta-lactamase class C family)
MKSVSKSVASLAIGIAIDRGLIPSVNESIWSFFPELSDLRSAEDEDIRLSHVLSMSMGLEWVEATPDTGDFNNDEARMYLAWDPCRYVRRQTRCRRSSQSENFRHSPCLFRPPTVTHVC